MNPCRSLCSVATAWVLALAWPAFAPAALAPAAFAQARPAPGTEPPADNTAATPPRWQVNAFGSLGVSRLNRGGVRLQPDLTAADGIGDHWTARHDSRLGVQIGLAVAPTLSLTWQPVLRHQRDGRFVPHTDWAYANWRPSPDWELRLGRYASPLYLVSEERLIGLSLPWVRPPPEVYGLLGHVEWLDGLWLRRNLALGDHTLRIDAVHARHRDHREALAINHNPISGLSLSLQDTHWTWHAMVARSQSTLRLDGLVPLLTTLADPALGGDAAALPDYDLRRLGQIHFRSLGLRYEAGAWLVMAEWAHGRSQRKGLPGSRAVYATVGHSWGPWSAYLTLAGLGGLDPGPETRLAGPARSVAGLFLASARESGQARLALGARWDIRPGLGLKAQVDHIRPRSGGRGGLFLYTPPATGLPRGHTDAQVFSLVLDWAH